MKNKNFHSISVLVDNDSWILPYAEKLVLMLSQDYDCNLLRSALDIPHGDICFLLGCVNIVSKEILSRNQFNLVVHESDLPQGKGFAPMSWQILEGKNEIPICLVEATDKVDSGQVWLRDTLSLNGSELHDEWRDIQGKASIKLAQDFLKNFDKLTPNTQKGEISFYAKRTPKDSELATEKSLIEQFNLLRIVSNKDYPAYFVKDGVKYKIEITREK